MNRQARSLVALAALLVPAAGATSLSSCNFVVGAGDFALGADAGSVTSESGPDGGIACGQGLPKSSDSTFETLMKACVYTASCDPFYFDHNISWCMTYDYLDAVPSLGCLSSIASCDLYYTCEGQRQTTSTDCPGDAGTSTCSLDNTAVNCGGSQAGLKLDCTKLGGTCATYADDGGTSANCLVVPTCSGSTVGCSGTKQYSCIGGKGFGEDCAQFAATCTDSDGGPTCLYQANKCTTTGSKCSEGKLEVCTPEHQSVTYDCTKAGGICSIDQSGTGYCTSPGCSTSATACSEDTSEKCEKDGITLTVCVGGAPYSIDCSKLPGFTHCYEDTLVSGVTYGGCQ